MTLTRCNSAGAVTHWQREINRLFGGPVSRAPQPYPLLNVSETTDGYQLVAKAPGIAPESIKVSVVGRQLTIEGERNSGGQDVTSEAYHRAERASGKFVRTLTLPAPIDAEAVRANYKLGLLSIELPKTESAKPRQIAVNLN